MSGPIPSKSQFAYTEVKRRILAEELGPGAPIGQERLASELGISTTPLREALKQLAGEGLVTLSSHRDAAVTQLTAAEAQDLLDLRRVLDPFAAGLAAERRGPPDLAAIASALDALHPVAAQPTAESLHAHRAFHRAIYRASHNPSLIGILDGLWDRSDRYRLLGLRHRVRPGDHVERVRAEHAAIADAVAAGDPATARGLMLEHVDRSLIGTVVAELRAGDR
ncbi:MAG: GntR family transcriptional regulator [Micropruina sp.]|uniref:GntR family transcriptional regulator n=1 Tax=Micropruina sp. TaxID=2737536 RepID=UPI0039E49DB8